MKSVQELYGTGHLADMALLVGGRKLPAHRHVLAPHSPVFERMFMTSMSEVWASPISSRILKVFLN